MTDENQGTDNQEPTALDLLKQEADDLGIPYHPNIGEETLTSKIAEHKAKEAAKAVKAQPKLTPAQIAMNENRIKNRQRAIRQRKASRLIRCTVMNMNPLNSDRQGEIIVASNDVTEEKRFVPFNVETHVPEIILNMMEERMYQGHRVVNLPNGKKTKAGVLRKEFNIQRLPALSEEELKELAASQQKRQAVD